MSTEDQTCLRTVVASIWDAGLVNRWNMNEAVGDVTSTAVKAILDCSEAFSLVPEPPDFLPGWQYVVDTFTEIAAYILGVSESQTYRACVVTAALNYRTAMELASIGV